MGRYYAQAHPENDHERTPEQMLLISIIERAILDYLSDYKKPSDQLLTLYEEFKVSNQALTRFAKERRLRIQSIEEQFKRVRRFYSASARSEPGQWLFSDTDEPFSFIWALGFLYEDVEGMAKHIRKIVEAEKNTYAGKSFRYRVQTG